MAKFNGGNCPNSRARQQRFSTRVRRVFPSEACSSQLIQLGVAPRLGVNCHAQESAYFQAQQVVARAPASAEFCSRSARLASRELPPVKRVTAASRNGVTLAPDTRFRTASARASRMTDSMSTLGIAAAGGG